MTHITHRPQRLQQGFTLIELMVVAAIIAILAAIAYPSYAEHVARSRRADAKAALQEAAQWMERQFTVSNNYSRTGNGATIDNAFLATAPLKAYTGTTPTFYTLSFETAPTANAYRLQMLPIGAMASDKCGAFLIDQAGTQTLSVDASMMATCWDR